MCKKETLVLARLRPLMGRTRGLCREDARTSRGRRTKPLFSSYRRAEPFFPLLLRFSMTTYLSTSRLPLITRPHVYHRFELARQCIFIATPCENENFLLTPTVQCQLASILKTTKPLGAGSQIEAFVECRTLANVEHQHFKILEKIFCGFF